MQFGVGSLKARGGNLDQKPGPPSWGLCGRPAPCPCEKQIATKPSSEKPRMFDGLNRIRNRRRKWTLNFRIWNIQGLGTKQKEVLWELTRLNIDVAILSETKKKGTGSEKLGEFSHFYSGVDKSCRAKAGVALLIRKKLVRHIESWEAINERIMTLRLRVRGHKVVIVGVYAPNDDANVGVKETFYETLTSVIEGIPQDCEVVLAGDFNGRVGKDQNSEIVGPHGEDIINDNGERLRDLVGQFDLKITNGFFKHKEIHKYTWHQDTRGLKSIIDYFIVKQTAKLKIQDVRVKRGAECGSDHWLLEAKVYIPFNDRGVKHDERLGHREGLRFDLLSFNLDSLDNYSTRML